ncbi:putative D polymerase epsilon subunit 3-like [Daphnia sinensis]|uniref:DNA polymerase epsilon subunit 3 n=1 Tax=Daphnia sinensis TaxID=1820382 RepID=A0AAD5KE99_9CRUS|nr:putative D polymerase epsilon subunit 3-like [Daphnia sinensis]
MAERPEDLNLPNSIVARIIKDSLPEGVNVSKEARTAIAKAASVFVLYCTSCSNNLAMRANRKIISGQDVLGAMADMEFERFIEPLQASLEEAVAKRKQEKSDKKPEDIEEGSDEGGENEKENEDEDEDESS